MKYFLIFAILGLVIFFYIKISTYFNIVDQPNSRSSHIEVTVRGGGIIFPIGALIWFLLSDFQYPFFFLGLTIISLISFWDDIKQLSFQTRLVFQFGAILLLFSEVGFLQYPWWIWILFFMVATAIINAFNFMDGINGITGAYSLSVLTGLWLINVYKQNFIENEFLYFIAISLVVFCFFNFRNKAICFAGDVGSISIAFILIFLISKLVIQTGNLLFLLLISVYGIDSMLTIVNRIWNNENIFVPHRKHLYQLMANELRIPHIIVASIYSILQLTIIFVICLVLNDRSSNLKIWITGIIILIFLVLIFTIARNKIKIAQVKQ